MPRISFARGDERGLESYHGHGRCSLRPRVATHARQGRSAGGRRLLARAGSSRYETRDPISSDRRVDDDPATIRLPRFYARDAERLAIGAEHAHQQPRGNVDERLTAAVADRHARGRQRDGGATREVLAQHRFAMLTAARRRPAYDSGRWHQANDARSRGGFERTG